MCDYNFLIFINFNDFIYIIILYLLFTSRKTMHCSIRYYRITYVIRSFYFPIIYRFVVYPNSCTKYRQSRKTSIENYNLLTLRRERSAFSRRSRLEFLRDYRGIPLLYIVRMIIYDITGQRVSSLDVDSNSETLILLSSPRLADTLTKECDQYLQRVRSGRTDSKNANSTEMRNKRAQGHSEIRDRR